MGHRQRSVFKKAQSSQKQHCVQGTEAGGEEHGRMLRGLEEGQQDEGRERKALSSQMGQRSRWEIPPCR